MSDISNQLIKDSYNYVLQSDLVTGIVYRIGGQIPVNPIFQSGLTINSGFTYSDGTEQNGYVLTCDPFGNAKWAPVSGTTPTSGVTSITTGVGLSGDSTTGAVTIINTAPDQTVTITGGTNIQINGTYPNFGIDFTGTTGGGDYLPLSGGTVTGGTIFQSGLTANTISATTYYNLPVSAVTNGTGISATTSNGLVTITNTSPDQIVTITGGTNIQINGTYPNFGIDFTGNTSGDYLPLSGGTVTGGTIFQSGLTANTISATTYYNLPVTADTFVTGFSITNDVLTLTQNRIDSYSAFSVSLSAYTGEGLNYFISAITPTGVINSGDRWFNTTTGIELVWIDDGDSQQWVQPFSVPGPLSPDVGYYLTTGITTSQTITWDKTYWGISGSGNVDIVLPPTISKEGYYLIIKDEAGICGTYRIRLTPTSGTIDGNNYVDMNINFMSLTCLVRGGNWYLI